jgi:hypothetical protein
MKFASIEYKKHLMNFEFMFVQCHETLLTTVNFLLLLLLRMKPKFPTLSPQQNNT